MSGKDSGRDDNEPNLIDMAEKILDFAKEHEEILEGFSTGGIDGNVTVREPLAEAEVRDDKVVIVAEAKGQKADKMSVQFDEGKMEFSIGDKDYEAEVPDDIIEESVQAELNNGVLRVEVDRDDSTDVNNIDVEWSDESIEGDDDGKGFLDDDGDNGGGEDGSD